MAAIKTKITDTDVSEFINSFADTEQKKKDAFELVEFMRKLTGYDPKIWGSSIIGFGQYHYKSDRSKQEGDWPLVGFSPRKAAISLYVYTPTPENEKLLEDLGKYKMGKGCIYVKKLSDIHLEILQKMIQSTIEFLELKFGKSKMN